jgi:hypothetical protein
VVEGHGSSMGASYHILLETMWRLDNRRSDGGPQVVLDPTCVG